jgi:hypothetical protein
MEATAWAAYKNATAAAAGCCLSASLRAKTLREIKENMGQCKSKARDFKEQKRRKTLDIKF